MRLTTLIYHDVLSDSGVDDSGFSGADAASYKLSSAQFRKHLELIAGGVGPTGPLRVVGSESLANSIGGVVLTFDDGGKSGVGRVAGLLEELAWRAHFFVTTNYVGTPGFLTPSDIRRLHASGHVVGSHSVSHPARMSSLSMERVAAEWRDSCAAIADILGAPVRTASVPGGYYSPDVGRIASECGIEVLFTSEPTRIVANIETMAVVGRFSVTRRTSDSELVSLVTGRHGAVLRQRLLWDAKKVAKGLGGGAWLAVRKRLFDLGLG